MCAALLLLPAGAAAQASGYSAVPIAMPAKANVMTRATLWKCAGDTCTTPQSDERDAVLCQLAAREMGILTAFTARGAPFDADALARCNARAR
ncbi:CC_3452 family protein [Sphingomonas guangdongensis]|nr:hypothetical protein [Sphingomonas guangdongensis]